MLSIYPACFFKEADGGYSVIFPDLNWLATQGDNLQDAMEMAVDCLAGYLYDCQKEGEEVPAPSKLSEINLNEIAKELDPDAPACESFLNMVSVDVKAYANIIVNETGEVTKSYNIFLLNYASINADRGFFLSPEVVNKWVKDKAASDLEPVLEQAKLLQEVWVKAVITQMGERSFTRITEFLTEDQVKVLKQMGLLQSKGELSEPAEILPENSEDEEADPF